MHVMITNILFLGLFPVRVYAHVFPPFLTIIGYKQKGRKVGITSDFLLIR